MKKVIRIILITVLAVVILTIGGCAVILGIIGHKGKKLLEICRNKRRH